MKALSRFRRIAKWCLGLALLLVLLGAALAPWPETQVTKAVSLQMADGLLTIRTWGTAGGSSQGISTDDPQRHPRGIPDTRNIPLWALLLGLAVPSAVLWWPDLRHTRRTAPGRPYFSGTGGGV